MSWSVESLAERAIHYGGTFAAVAVHTVMEHFVPAQAIRCALDRDFSRAVTKAAAVYDAAERLSQAEEAGEVSEPRAQCLGCGDVDTAGHDCGRLAHADGCPCVHCYWKRKDASDQSPAASAGGENSPAGVSEPPKPSPPAGHLNFSDGVLAAANIVGAEAQKQWRAAIDSPLVNPVVSLESVATRLDGLTQELRDHAAEHAQPTPVMETGQDMGGTAFSGVAWAADTFPQYQRGHK